MIRSREITQAPNAFLKRMSFQKPDIFFLGLALVCISLPFAKHLNSLAIGALAVSWLFSSSWKNKLANFRKNRWVWLFIGYYLLHLLGLAYTENTKAGLFILEKKSGMWVLPVLLASATPLSKRRFQQLLMLFVIACTIGISICLGKGLYWLLIHDNDQFLSYHALSKTIGIHAVYFSVYLSFCVFILLRFLTDAPLQLSVWLKRGLYLWTAYLMTGIFLLASKTMIIALLLCGSAAYIGYILKEKKYRHFLTYFVLLIISIALIYKIPQTNARFQQLFQTELGVLDLEEYRYDTPFSGLSLRMVIWKYSLRILEEDQHWLTGVGPGDSQDQLDQTYREIGIYTGNPNFGDHGYLGYNTHNQFLQSWLDLGLPGLLLLIAIFVLLFRQSLRFHNDLLALLTLLFLIFCLTESALEAHHGSVFFSLFTTLLLSGEGILNGGKNPPL